MIVTYLRAVRAAQNLESCVCVRLDITIISLYGVIRLPKGIDQPVQLKLRVAQTRHAKKKPSHTSESCGAARRRSRHRTSHKLANFNSRQPPTHTRTHACARAREREPERERESETRRWRDRNVDIDIDNRQTDRQRC